jgi:hypothetical protein
VIKVTIKYATYPDEVMHSTASYYNMGLRFRWIAWDVKQYVPLHLQNTKGPFNDISKR